MNVYKNGKKRVTLNKTEKGWIDKVQKLCQVIGQLGNEAGAEAADSLGKMAIEVEHGESAHIS